MKKSLLIAGLAYVALAACTKNEVVSVAPDQEITFQTAINKASTRALISSTAYPTDVPFGTVAYTEESTPQNYINNSEVSFNGTKKYWSTATAYYWPLSKTLSFMSWSPFKYQETGSRDTPVTVTHEYNKLTIDNYDVAAHQETDLMVADVAKGQTANTTQIPGWVKGVPTVFHHKLSQVIKFNFQTVDTQNPSTVKDYANGHNGETGTEYQAGDQQYYINEVSFKGLYFTGKYTYDATSATDPVSESWATTGTTTASTLWFKEQTENQTGKFSVGKYEPKKTSDAGVGETNQYLLVLPQKFPTASGPTIHIKYTIHTYIDASTYSSETIESDINLYDIHTSHAWDMNKKITYTISLAKQRIYWAPSVVKWETDTDTISF